ncbi:MAG: hypothetical protein H7333_04565 [Bdellovibrionales bacterium]|nr:hypothetical protein [Oligoflexia bacterium]
MKHLLLFSLALSTAALASKPAHKVPVKTNATPALEVAKNDLLLDIDGNIYPRDQLPQTCPDLLKGVKCLVDSFGHYHVESKKEGELIYSKAVFSGPEGPQVIEESWEKDGHVQKAVVENHALEKRSELEVRDGKVYYKVTDLKDQSVKTAEDKYQDNLVVPSTVMSYIRPHNAELAAGKDVSFRIAVLDRKEAYTFNMKKIRNEKAANGDEVMVLQMSPSSIIVKALVDPMYFYISVKTGEMFAFEGKSALRRKEGEKYKEMAVRTTYQYKVNQFKVAEAPRLNIGEPCTDDMIKTGAVKCSIPEMK